MRTWSEVRARILRDPALQSRLRAIRDQEDFCAAVADLAGGTLDLGEPMRDARRSYIERSLPLPPEPLDDADPTGWTPMTIRSGAAEPQVEWCDLRGLDLSADAFFVETVHRALREPYRLLVRMRTPLDALTGVPDVAGLIMHMSRCGSTLACRMLATDPTLVVVSEPEPLDQLLRLQAPEDARARWVAGLLAAFGMPGRRLVVKPDAWCVLDMDVLKASVPGTPWVFLTRDPSEVIASQLREPGSHMIPGHLRPEELGLDLATAVAMPRAEYCARVLDRIAGAAREALDAEALVVDYAEMPGAVIDRIRPHFGVDGDPERMRAASVADAKRPYEGFDAGRTRAERPITPEVRDAGALVGRVAP